MTSILKHICADKLDNIVNKYNNSYLSTIKMRPVDVKSNRYIDYGKTIMLVIMLKYQNIKMFLEQVTLQISQKTFL